MVTRSTSRPCDFHQIQQTKAKVVATLVCTGIVFLQKVGSSPSSECVCFLGFFDTHLRDHLFPKLLWVAETDQLGGGFFTKKSEGLGFPHCHELILFCGTARFFSKDHILHRELPCKALTTFGWLVGSLGDVQIVTINNQTPKKHRRKWGGGLGRKTSGRPWMEGRFRQTKIARVTLLKTSNRLGGFHIRFCWGVLYWFGWWKTQRDWFLKLFVFKPQISRAP